MDSKSEGQQDEEDNSQKSIDIKNHEEKKDSIVEAIKGNAHKENEDMINTDEDTYYNYLENIETSILGEENLQKDSAAFINFSLGDQLEDQPEAILHYLRNLQRKYVEFISHGQVSYNWRKWSKNICKTIFKPKMKQYFKILDDYEGKSQEADFKFQDYEKVDGFKRI